MGKRRDKFYIGQRVKSVQASIKVPALGEGHHGTILTSRKNCIVDDGEKLFGYDVAFDGVDPRTYGHTAWCCEEKQLEPLYDGNQTVSWSTCAWQPIPAKQKRGKAVSHG